MPPEIDDIKEYSKDFMEFLNQNAKKDDFVLIQGILGLCFVLLNIVNKII